MYKLQIIIIVLAINHIYAQTAPCQYVSPDGTKYDFTKIARKDISTSYHLSVTIDDDADDVSHIIRGEDLLESTHIHRLIQILLNLKETTWLHHSLKLDQDGNRIAKRSGSLLTIKKLRESGLNFSEVINLANKK